ncbi:uncharacterized protein LOC100840316 [Brachypodium distachyon]|uniref:DNA-directed RNA polymerase II subunit RPB9-like zinc ribbon domain-containing protein n=1 Tax=Brachypodium distachyon TaxID=15368 RepID=A0A0Q3JQ95_BRADI|nr:uncharacterized protein LOC100840316 [Brachypodium distachyon]KQK00729.1 hypothetical protein BRADI_3g51447v3 [Brachypodium distachyon]|eukprot:XP_003570080.1 uncharacterized protein LOC100840316 [Brachypodium distachyon]
MEFCPACGMLLQIQPATGGHRLRLFCPTCQYVCPIKHKIVKKAKLVKKELESTESASKTDGEPKESASKTDGEPKQSAPKTDGEPKQSAPKIDST